MSRLTISRPERYLAIGIHTTGLNPGEDRIVSLTAREMVRRGQDWMAPVREHVFLFNPGRDIEKGASRAHRFGWDPEGPPKLEYGRQNLRFERTFEAQADLVRALLLNDPRPTLCVHTPGFILPFLDAELERAGLPELSGSYVDVGALEKPSQNRGRRRSGLTDDNTLKGLASASGVSTELMKEISSEPTTATARLVELILREPGIIMKPADMSDAPHRKKLTARPIGLSPR